MPYHTSTRDLPALSKPEELKILFASTALADLGRVLAPGPVRRSAHPPLLSFAILAAGRIYGSQRAALTELNAPGVWAQVTEAYRRRLRLEVPLPPKPPAAHQQDRFVAWLTSQPDVVAALSAEFTTSAVGQARHQGNFQNTQAPDFANPDPRSTVFGDGTYYTPYSNVHFNEDGELVGTRATVRKPRRQDNAEGRKTDGKQVRGVNHITVTTWTKAGWVVLANEQTTGPEVDAAERAVGRVHDALGPLLHSLIWDGAIAGRRVTDQFARRNIVTINKIAARSSAKQSGYTPPALSVTNILHLHETQQPLPLGITVHPATKEPKIIKSSFYPLQVHTTGPCRHELWVDDGSLVDVERRTDGHLYKAEHAHALSAHSRRCHENNHTLTATWGLPCPQSPEGWHQITTSWTPRTDGKDPKGRAAALASLRPLSPSDDRFWDMYGLRNITESYNSWVKSRLGWTGRGMRLDVRAQFLDHLCAGVLANALSAHRYATRIAWETAA